MFDKLGFLKEELNKMRTRIVNVYKHNFARKAIGETLENNLKRPLMNAVKVLLASYQRRSMAEECLEEGNMLHYIDKSNSTSVITCQNIPQNSLDLLYWNA